MNDTERYETFFLRNRESEWFREKYHADESLALKRSISSRRVGFAREFQVELENGEYDSISFEATEDLGNTCRFNLASFSRNVLYITKIPIYIKRSELEEILKEKNGFEYLILSDPRIKKSMPRGAWIIFNSTVDLDEVCQELDGQKIGEFSLHVIPNRPYNCEASNLPSFMNSITRLKTDLEQAKRLARALDKECGINEDAGVSIIDKWMQPETIILDKEQEGVKKLKKYLDLLIYYLMKVHQYDYYGGVETASIEGFIRKVTISLRPSEQGSFDKSEESFVGSIDSRINLRIDSPSDNDERITQLGGRSLAGVLAGNESQKHSFPDNTSVIKNVKDPELVKTLTVDTRMFNAYVLDHCKVESRKSEPRDTSKGDNGNRPRDKKPSGKPSRQPHPRQSRSYVDLDAAVVDGDVELQYDSHLVEDGEILQENEELNFNSVSKRKAPETDLSPKKKGKTSVEQKSQTLITDERKPSLESLLRLRVKLLKFLKTENRTQSDLIKVDGYVKEAEEFPVDYELFKESKIGKVLKFVSKLELPQDTFDIVNRAHILINKWRSILQN